MQEFCEQTETMEDLERKGFRLIQARNGFRFGEDSTLLAYFVAQEAGRRRKGTKILELGTNCGAATILLAARRPDVFIDGLEIQHDAFLIFQRNILLNNLSSRVRSFESDLRLAGIGKMSEIQKSSYDLVFFNPPFYSPGQGPDIVEKNDINGREIARYEQNGTIEDFIRASDRFLLPQGKMVLIHRTRRLPDVIHMMNSYRIEPQKLRFIHPRADKPATLFMICGQKHAAKGGCKVLAPLFLYGEDSKYSTEMQRIYKE